MPIRLGFGAFIPAAFRLNVLGVGSAFTVVVRLVEIVAHIVTRVRV
jgi:hypothetical protein